MEYTWCRGKHHMSYLVMYHEISFNDRKNMRHGRTSNFFNIWKLCICISFSIVYIILPMSITLRPTSEMDAWWRQWRRSFARPSCDSPPSKWWADLAVPPCACGTTIYRPLLCCAWIQERHWLYCGARKCFQSDKDIHVRVASSLQIWENIYQGARLGPGKPKHLIVLQLGTALCLLKDVARWLCCKRRLGGGRGGIISASSALRNSDLKSYF